MLSIIADREPVVPECLTAASIVPRRQTRRQNWAIAMIATLISTLPMTVHADVDATPAPEPTGDGVKRDSEFKHWLVHLDAAGVFMNESAKIYVGGRRVPGGSVAIGNDPTLTFDVSYLFTPNLAINIYSGVPPRAAVKGAGSLAQLGALATTRYGSVALSGEYHFTNFERLQPYVGAGVNYTPFLDVRDRALSNVQIPSAFGAAFKVGADYQLTGRWTAHSYVQQILLSTRVSAMVDGIGVVTKTTINPTVIGAGVGWRF
jgi:outer membrane protein